MTGLLAIKLSTKNLTSSLTGMMAGVRDKRAPMPSFLRTLLPTLSVRACLAARLSRSCLTIVSRSRSRSRCNGAHLQPTCLPDFCGAS